MAQRQEDRGKVVVGRGVGGDRLVRGREPVADFLLDLVPVVSVLFAPSTSYRDSLHVQNPHSPLSAAQALAFG